MNYVVLQTGGKQYKVSPDSVFLAEKLESGSKKELVFDKILLYVNEDTIHVGAPYIEGAQVTATELEQVKGEKVEVFKFKAKSRHRRHYGHRQVFSKIKVEEVKLKDSSEKSVKTKKRETTT